jgi:hypothetical protein
LQLQCRVSHRTDIFEDPTAHEMIKQLFIFLSIYFLMNDCKAQAPSIQWQKSFGGFYDEEANSIIQLEDGSYIIAGVAKSISGDVIGNHSINGGSGDIWIIRIDSNGTLLWQKCFGGTSDESLYSIAAINDGFIIAGTASSDDGDVTGVHFSNNDYWVIKTDSLFNIVWEKCYGGQQAEVANEICKTMDGGYIINGFGTSIDGDMFNNTHGTSPDYWVVKIDSIGAIQWQRALGGYISDWGISIHQCADGSYIAGGSAGGPDHDITCSQGGYDNWIVYLDSSGNIQNQVCLGGSGYETLGKMYFTNDGGYLVTGSTTSNDGNVSGSHGMSDVWLAKSDSAGIIQWQSCMGGLLNEQSYSMDLTSDNGIIIAGWTNSNDSIISSHGNHDFYVAKTDSIGNFQWQIALGGSGVEEANAVIQARDGGYLVAGYSDSFNGDVTGNHGARDFWVVKLAPLGLIVPQENQITQFASWFRENILNLKFFSSKSEKASLKLFDSTGRMLLTQDMQINAGLNKNKFQTAQITPGVYIVILQSQDIIITKKVIVN